MSRFLEWIGLKERLSTSFPKVPLVSEGQIWWASLGENIGREINGKNELFARPVLIYKKLSQDLYFVIPFTSKAHVGSWFSSYLNKATQENMYACLHQARSIDYRRLAEKFGEMGKDDFDIIKNAFEKLYKT